MTTTDKPSIAELQSANLACRCGGVFSRAHNETRGCPRHGNLPSDVAARERLLNAAPVLLEIAAAALERRAAVVRSEAGTATNWEAVTAATDRLNAALAKVRP